MKVDKLDYNETLLQVYCVRKLSHFAKYESGLYETVLSEIK